MLVTERLETESQEDWGKRLGLLAANELEDIHDELIIREITLKYWKPIRNEITSDNSIKRPRTAFANAITNKFPNSTEAKPGYHYTKPRGEEPIWEHLALWYATANKKRWDVIGDEAREEYKNSFNKPKTETTQNEVTQTELTQTETTETTQTTLKTLNDMNISQLQLDIETQEIVENAIAHSGMSLADFVRKACQVYAKTVTGKQGQYESDLTTVSTQELLKHSAYKTHPGRAEELAKRAIYALETHNNNCTEKSQKWMITQSAIQSLTGSKPATIKAILERYQTRLDDHNDKHELNPYDNRKAGLKIDEDINLIKLVPDGVDLI
jgi:uncharacterized protein YajQ (UPF0234 family)